MSLMEKVTSFVTGNGGEPARTVHVVDPSPLNWLYITYNTIEELVRVNAYWSRRGCDVPVWPMALICDNTATITIRWIRRRHRFGQAQAARALTSWALLSC